MLPLQCKLLILGSVVAGPLAAVDAATVAYWRFENGTHGAAATSLTDSAGSNTGTATNGPLYSNVTPVSPVPQTGASNGLSLDFERDNSQYFTVPDDNALDFGANSAFTIEAWVKLESVTSGTGTAGDRQWLALKKSGSAADSAMNYAFLVQGGNNFNTQGTGTGNQIFLVLGNGSSTATFTDADLKIIDTDWHYVAARFSDTDNKVTLTVDSVSKDFATMFVPAANSQLLQIGRHTNSTGAATGYFDGRIDELRISNSYLSDNDLLRVPEPATAGLLLLGAVAALGQRSRRRRAIA
jgi:hypothetical protein